jgi:drug/metabolite transporter (DMT)-like permease
LKLVVAYVVCALVWGTTWFAIRVSIGDGGYPTIASAALRFTVATALVVPLYLLGLARPGPRGRRQWGWLCAAGVLNALGYALVYIGEESLSGGLTAVLFGTEPLMAAILVTLTRTESVAKTDVAGALVSLAGIAIIFWDRLEVSADEGTAVGVVLMAVLVSTSYTLIVKRHAAGVHPLASAGVFLTITAVTLWIATLVTWKELPWPPPLEPTVALVYLGVFGSVVTFSAYFYLLGRVSVMTVMTMVFVVPVVALAVDLMWEDEARFLARTWVGIGVTLGGVLLGLVARPRRRSEISQTTPEI